jgi:hypothetical protein
VTYYVTYVHDMNYRPKIRCYGNPRSRNFRAFISRLQNLFMYARYSCPWGSGCTDPCFLDLVLVGGEWSASRPDRFTPGKTVPVTHWIGGWVGPRTGLDDVERRTFLTLPGLELRPLCRPARSQSLYRLSYPGS